MEFFRGPSVTTSRISGARDCRALHERGRHGRVNAFTSRNFSRGACDLRAATVYSYPCHSRSSSACAGAGSGSRIGTIHRDRPAGALPSVPVSRSILGLSTVGRSGAARCSGNANTYTSTRLPLGSSPRISCARHAPAEVHLSTSLRHKAPRHAVLVSVQCPNRSDAAAERSLNELEQLLRGLGIRVHARLVQKRQHPTATYVGEGKLRELAGLTGGSGKVSRVPIPSGSAPRAGAIGLVVVDDELSPGQQRSLRQEPLLQRFSIGPPSSFGSSKGARAREAMLGSSSPVSPELPGFGRMSRSAIARGGGGRASRGIPMSPSPSSVPGSDRRAATRARRASGWGGGAPTATGVGAEGRARRGTPMLESPRSCERSPAAMCWSRTSSSPRSIPRCTLVPPTSPPSSSPTPSGSSSGSRIRCSLLSTRLSTRYEASLLLFVVDAADSESRRQLEVTRQTVKEIGAGSLPHLVVLNKIDRVSGTFGVRSVTSFPKRSSSPRSRLATWQRFDSG